MTYIWQHPDWPCLYFEPTAGAAAALEYAKAIGRAAGAAGQISQDVQAEAMLDLMVTEAINSSLIENERLNADDLRSSLKNYLGLNQPPVRVPDARAEGIAALMVDVRQDFHSKLTAERLCNWHRMVLHDEDAPWRKPLLRGQWRRAEEPMQIVSGPIHRPVVHYEAPPASRVPAEMERFLAWYAETQPRPDSPASLSGPQRAAIAHLWFESIHPFEDGNGRVGRAIAEHALMQDFRQPLLMSLSAALMARRAEYYAELQAASGCSIDVTPWVSWFCSTVLAAQQEAMRAIDFVLRKARFWSMHGQADLNARQLKLVRRLFEAGPDGFEGGLNVRKYQGLTGASKPTATRDLTDLVGRGIFKVEGAGKSTRYQLNLDAFPGSVQAPFFDRGRN